MNSLRSTLLVLALLAAGCETEAPAPLALPAAAPAIAPDAAVGRPVLAVILAVSGRPVQYFDPSGKPLPQLPAGSGGSASVFDPNRMAQDNYTFDASGIVTRHLQSYGTNYSAGVWTEAR